MHYGFCNSYDLQKTSLSQKTGKFRIYCIDDNGVQSEHHVSKSALYNKFGLTIRDLRFHHPNMIFVRNQKLIMRFQDLKVLVSPDAILLIDPPFNNRSISENSIKKFWTSLPTLITQPVLYTSNLPLEYRALEAIFVHVVCEFSRSLSDLQPEIMDLLKNLTDPTSLVVDRSLVHVLLKSSTRLNRFSSQLAEFSRALEEILEHEETIRKYCISCTNMEGDSSRSMLDAFVFSPMEESSEEKTDSAKSFETRFPGLVQHKYKINLQDEMETLLDSFLKDAEEISNVVKELKEAIDTSTSAILINLDSYRNSILRFELELTIGMFCFGLFGLIGMVFGMNLESSLEKNTYAFWCVAGLMLCGSGALWRYLLRLSRKPLPQNSDLLKKFSAGHDAALPCFALVRFLVEPHFDSELIRFGLKDYQCRAAVTEQDILSKKKKKPPSSGGPGSPPGCTPPRSVKDFVHSKIVNSKKQLTFSDQPKPASTGKAPGKADMKDSYENLTNLVSEQAKIFSNRNPINSRRLLASNPMKSLIDRDVGVSKILREQYHKP